MPRKNEKEWDESKEIVKEQKDKSQSELSDQDWGLIQHITTQKTSSAWQDMLDQKLRELGVSDLGDLPDEQRRELLTDLDDEFLSQQEVEHGVIGMVDTIRRVSAFLYDDHGGEKFVELQDRPVLDYPLIEKQNETLRDLDETQDSQHTESEFIKNSL